MLLKVLFLVVFATVQLSTAELVESINDGIPRTCSTSIRDSGIQHIYPQPGFGQPFDVYCEQDYEGGGWVVIQNRFDGSVNFNRDWSEYENGFGDMNGEHWLGLKKIHELTYSKQYKLHILLELANGTQFLAKYGEFSVAGPTELYRLNRMGDFSGDVPDQLINQWGMKFSTFDADNDVYFGNCAQDLEGGWWFSSCGWSRLNAMYERITWYPLTTGIKITRMMIRATD